MSNPKVITTVKIDPQALQRLSEFAAQNERSRSAEVRVAINQHLSQHLAKSTL
jgi:predicted transcriptional regulator